MTTEPEKPDTSADIAAALLRKAKRLLAGESHRSFSPDDPHQSPDTSHQSPAYVEASAGTPAWCKGTEGHATDARGNFVEPWYESACRWTVIGALARYGMRAIPLSPVPGLRDESEFNAAWKYLFMAALVQSSAMSTPNGINNAGIEKTQSLIDFAIRLAENRAELLITLALEPESAMGKEMAAKAAEASKPVKPN